MDRRVTEDEGAGGRFDGFVLSIEEGKTLGGIRNVEATEILRRSQSSDREEQEKTLVKYARERGCLFRLESIRQNFKYLDKGGESEVYLDSDLAPNNFVKGNDGELYCIDSIIYLR